MRTGSRSSGFLHVVRAGLLAVGPNRRRLAVVSVLALLLGACETTVVYLVARLGLSIQDTAMEISLGGGPLPTIVVSLGEGVLLAGGVLVLTIAIAFPLSRTAAQLSRDTLIRQRGDLIHRYLAADWSDRSSKREGYLQSLMGDHANRSEKLVDVISTVIVSLSGMLAIGAAALVLAPAAAVVAMVGLAAVGTLFRPLTRRLKDVANGWLVENNRLASRMGQTSRMSAEIMAFDVGPVVEEDTRSGIADSAAATAELRMFGRLIPLLFLYGAFALVLLIVGAVNISGSADFAAIGPLILLLVRALGYGKQLQTVVQTGIEYSPSVRDVESAIDDLAEHRASRGERRVPHVGVVDLEAVGFEYATGRPVLRDVTLRITPGDALAIVGPSGGGKTTLIQLLMRLRQPSSGRILVGNLDLRDIDRSSWAQLVGYVPQDNQLIHGSVADNIRFYRPEVKDEEMEQASRFAHLHDEVVAFPEGYGTLIGAGARDLSGGQRQRLGIARALVGRPELLVLDEPTSALDQRSEQLIRQVLLELKGTVTMVVVAHRPATMEICDRVVRIDRGSAQELNPQPRAG